MVSDWPDSISDVVDVMENESAVPAATTTGSTTIVDWTVAVVQLLPSSLLPTDGDWLIPVSSLGNAVLGPFLVAPFFSVDNNNNNNNIKSDNMDIECSNAVCRKQKASQSLSDSRQRDGKTVKATGTLGLERLGCIDQTMAMLVVSRADSGVCWWMASLTLADVCVAIATASCSLLETRFALLVQHTVQLVKCSRWRSILCCL